MCVCVVDCVAHAFDALRQDVKEDFVSACTHLYVQVHATCLHPPQGKGLFLAYRGVDAVLPFMRASNRALCGHAADIFLQLAVDSGT